MATVHDVAAAIVDRVGTMTAMKLEKLVYYSQAWHLARHRVTLFDDPIEAWREGPVIPALFQKHRGQYEVAAWSKGHPEALSEIECESVNWVAREYGRFSATQLSRMTHGELPWRMARGPLPESAPSNERINPEIMRNFYARQIADAETAVVTASASSALEGVELDDAWQDRLRDVATGLISADDLIAEEISRIRGV
jgi:uncharacterized phage-associated protein